MFLKKIRKMTSYREWWSGLSRRLHTGRVPKILAWLLAGWLLLLALGYLVAPPLARSVLTTQLGKALGRDVAIERVAINPLDLSVDVLGLSVKDRAGAEQLGFEKLHIDLSSASVTQAGVVVDDIRLQAPRVAVTRLADHLLGTEPTPAWAVAVPNGTSEQQSAAAMDIYLRAGVPHVWLVDPDAKLIEVYEARDGVWARVGAHDRGKVNLPPFEAAELDLDAMFHPT